MTNTNDIQRMIDYTQKSIDNMGANNAYKRFLANCGLKHSPYKLFPNGDILFNQIMIITSNGTIKPALTLNATSPY